MTVYADRGSSIAASVGTWGTTANAYDGATGTTPNTYATWTSTTSGATASIDVGGYDFSTVVAAVDTLNSVTVRARQNVNNVTRIPTITFQPFDGATAIGSAQTITPSTTTNEASATFPVTLAQLRSANFKVRITFTRAAVTQSATANVDHLEVSADYTPLPPTITQAAYCFYADGTESGSTVLAAQDTAPTVDVSSDANLQLRARLQSTSAVDVPATDDWQLQWERNASGTWTNVAAAGTVNGYNSPNLTDGAATTNRLTGGSGSFIAGKVSEDGLVDDRGWTANNFTELLYAMTLRSADLANADTLRFRVLRNGATTGLTFTATPTINVTKAAVTGRPKVYVAGAFTKKPLKVYIGGTWVEKPVKVWTGSTWKVLT